MAVGFQDRKHCVPHTTSHFEDVKPLVGRGVDLLVEVKLRKFCEQPIPVLEKSIGVNPVKLVPVLTGSSVL